jgi:hypothetical protein
MTPMRNLVFLAALLLATDAAHAGQLDAHFKAPFTVKKAPERRSSAYGKKNLIVTVRRQDPTSGATLEVSAIQKRGARGRFTSGLKISKKTLTTVEGASFDVSSARMTKLLESGKLLPVVTRGRGAVDLTSDHFLVAGHPDDRIHFTEKQIPIGKKWAAAIERLKKGDLGAASPPRPR